MKDFPIPVTTIGAGSQFEEETLDYMPMPQGMETFRAPVLPEPEDVASCVLAHRALHEALTQLGELLNGADPLRENRMVDLRHLPPADLKLINQVMGEGEVSALVRRAGDGEVDGEHYEVRVQESVFAGVWRVIVSAEGQIVSDSIELGAVPRVLKTVAQADVAPAGSMPRWEGPLPPNVQNAPAILAELEDHWASWRPGQPAQVLNMTLLPMSVEDIGFLDHHLGTGRVLILSRGYGNCRITNTHRPHCWRVIYYNSQDVVILNTVEVTELPDVAQAAPEDLADSHERLKEVLAWVETGT